MARLHTQLRKLSVQYAVFWELMGRIELLARVCWPPKSPDLNPCDFYLWEELKNVLYANNAHGWRVENRIFMK
jgi:hypothetical protein